MATTLHLKLSYVHAKIYQPYWKCKILLNQHFTCRQRDLKQAKLHAVPSTSCSNTFQQWWNNTWKFSANSDQTKNEVTFFYTNLKLHNFHHSSFSSEYCPKLTKKHTTQKMIATHKTLKINKTKISKIDG